MDSADAARTAEAVKRVDQRLARLERWAWGDEVPHRLAGMVDDPKPERSSAFKAEYAIAPGRRISLWDVAYSFIRHRGKLYLHQAVETHEGGGLSVHNSFGGPATPTRLMRPTTGETKETA